MIPGWKVHDLDQLLCAMTAHLAPPVDLAVGAPESEREPRRSRAGLAGEAEDAMTAGVPCAPGAAAPCRDLCRDL